MNNNYIFTDIDGPLNPHWKKQWSKKAIGIYNRICKDFELHPVISSTWRSNHTIAQLQQIFNEQGITAEIYGYTQILDNMDRGLEIEQWLSENEYSKYVVIDDVISTIVPYVKNVIGCKSWIGLTEENYNEIKTIMNKS